MWTILHKEVNAFFSSLIGYLVIGTFLVIMGLVLFVFPDTSLLELNYATLDPLFDTAPTILLLLVPAITMRLLAEENQLGTIEFLATKPVSELEIILGKYFAALVLIAFALIPTGLYYLTIYQLGSPPGNIDAGAVVGSYLGLFLLAAVFAAIGIFASSLTANQITAFVLTILLCFLFYYGFFFFSKLPVFFGKTDDLIQQLGIDYHYSSISRGVIDTRDVIYFASVISLFIVFTLVSLERRKW
ncbi:MAG: gliding motility-associated ABC transporter permease subunit GldF [Lewinellaceae bacterium]|nr:gliding motility-associated ABC transporter permease subunit GldF [Lewinellaceae bacterium]